MARRLKPTDSTALVVAANEYGELIKSNVSIYNYTLGSVKAAFIHGVRWRENGMKLNKNVKDGRTRKI